MFSMVESRHCNFVNSELVTSFVTGASKLLVPGKVTASTSISQGAASDPIDPQELAGQPDIMQISVQENSDHLIKLDKKSQESWSRNTHWIRAVRLSDDCHTYNIQLRLQEPQKESLSKNIYQKSSNKYILHVVRPIQMGQELLLWFSEDVLAMLQVPFLTPANIQGQKKYVCTKCSALYESPNPLKLHIFLGCERYTIKTLWEKLLSTLEETHQEPTQNKLSFEFKLLPEPCIIRQKNAIDLSIASSRKLSAFTPFRKVQAESFLTPIPNNIPMWASFEQNNFHVQSSQNEEEAHIESLVSSLGRSKQGHICLYCGKCYSRKYGLKIHIRTHTGYKPLKCKFCMRPFGDPSNLNKHVRLHAEGNTPYKCDLCGKILVRRRDLDRHLKSRHMVEMQPGLNILEDELSASTDIKNEEDTLSS